MDDIELVSNGDPPPPLTVMSLALRTVVNSRNQQVEVVAVSCLVQHEFHIDRAAPEKPFQQHFCRKEIIFILVNLRKILTWFAFFSFNAAVRGAVAAGPPGGPRRNAGDKSETGGKRAGHSQLAPHRD